MALNMLSFATDLIEVFPQCACLYLSETDILFPNRRWRESLGITTRLVDLENLGINVDALEQHIERVVRTEGAVEWHQTLDPGENRQITVVSVPDHPNLYLILIHDYTEFKRVEQMRKDFIANVSHELRTPLTAVRGYVETLMDPKFQTLDHIREFLPIIFEHTERLHNLMLDLLSLSRLENPNTVIELNSLKLIDEIEDAVQAVGPLARLKHLTMDVQLPHDGLRVNANPEHLERVLVNLLDNAIKYSPSHGRVRIWTEIDGPWIWTHVADEGPGIASDEVERIFERFYRTKGALSTGVRGSGLGLAISKHIVQQLGGEIRVASTVGKGSDFYFSLKTTQAGMARRT